jgi:hypothetical protein
MLGRNKTTKRNLSSDFPASGTQEILIGLYKAYWDVTLFGGTIILRPRCEAGGIAAVKRLPISRLGRLCQQGIS